MLMYVRMLLILVRDSYGKIGSLILQHTLHLIFPAGSLDRSAFAPLSHSEFLARVLVPEAALRLIQDDLQQSTEEELLTMNASSEYGLGLFPADDSSSPSRLEGADEVERLVRDRADARRQELERTGDYENLGSQSVGPTCERVRPCKITRCD
jgi:hypothetical protein